MAQSILIVDDEKEIVSMLYCYFSKLGYTVYTATAGNAALKEVEKKPDIILLSMKICQRGMIYRKMAHLPPLIVMTKQNTQYLTRKETRYASSMLIIKKNAQYTNMSIRTMFHISKFYLILQTGIGLLTVL